MRMSRQMTMIANRLNSLNLIRIDSRENPKKLDKTTTLLIGPKCYRCQRYGEMKQKCPTYLKSIGKSKALAATLSDTELEVDSEDSDQEGTFMAFTATIEFPKESEDLIDDEKELMDSKFENMDKKDDIFTACSKHYKNFEKYEKLYRLATRKLSEVELE